MAGHLGRTHGRTHKENTWQDTCPLGLKHWKKFFCLKSRDFQWRNVVTSPFSQHHFFRIKKYHLWWYPQMIPLDDTPQMIPPDDTPQMIPTQMMPPDDPPQDYISWKCDALPFVECYDFYQTSSLKNPIITVVHARSLVPFAASFLLISMNVRLKALEYMDRGLVNPQ